MMGKYKNCVTGGNAWWNRKGGRGGGGMAASATMVIRSQLISSFVPIDLIHQQRQEMNAKAKDFLTCF